MTEFVINGVLDENKNLLFEGTPTCNQGENQTTKLSVSVPKAMAEGVDFYFEFLCPHNLWVSPKATTVVDADSTIVSYVLGGHVLREEGQVIVQLVARSVSDQTVVYKSALSSQSCIYVERSVNVQTSARAEDFFGQATNVLQQLADKEYVTMETLTPLLPTKVGQLQNDAGYITADDVSNCEVLINLGDERMGQFKLNQRTNRLITFPEYPVVNDATITIYQGGYSRGSFTLNQSKNLSIYLDGLTSTCTSFCGTEFIAHDDYMVVDYTEDCIIDLVISPESVLATTNGYGEKVWMGAVSLLRLNGTELSFSSLQTAPVYHTLQLVPQHMDQRWAIMYGGSALGYAPFVDPDEGYECLSIGVEIDVESAGAYVHYSVR